MKKINFPILIILAFLNTTVSKADLMSYEDCASLAGKAYTNYAAAIIFDECTDQEKVLFPLMYNEYLKCAIKAGKARTERAARLIYDECS